MRFSCCHDAPFWGCLSARSYRFSLKWREVFGNFALFHPFALSSGDVNQLGATSKGYRNSGSVIMDEKSSQRRNPRAIAIAITRAETLKWRAMMMLSLTAALLAIAFL
jgi:hypothetical protein